MLYTGKNQQEIVFAEVTKSQNENVLQIDFGSDQYHGKYITVQIVPIIDVNRFKDGIQEMIDPFRIISS